MNPVAALEAILFVAEAPVPEGEPAQVREVPPPRVKADPAAWAERLEREDRGIILRFVAGGRRLCLKPEALPYPERFATAAAASRLSDAALEVLAVVAYRQPVTPGQVSELRGVDSGSALRTLAGRGLVEVTGRLPTPGNPALHAITAGFLEALGLGSPAELPPLADHMPPPEVAESLDRTSWSPGDPEDEP